MIIALGADHRGYPLKEKLEAYLKSRGHEVLDEGDHRYDPEDDFPIFAQRVVVKILTNEQPVMGILLCGSGQGMAIAANRHKGIRAAVCWDVEQAKLARNDDDCNVLALPADLLSDREADSYQIVDAFLSTPFSRLPRFSRRIAELDA